MKIENTKSKGNFNTNFWPLPDDEIGKNIYVNRFLDYPNTYRTNLNKFGYMVLIDKVVDCLRREFNGYFEEINSDEFDRSENDNFVEKECFILISDHLVVKMMSNEICLFFYDSRYWRFEYFQSLNNYIYNNGEFYKKGIHENEISFITQSPAGNLSLTDFRTQEQKSIDIEKNYNDDFVDVDRRIKKYIQENKNGLILLHGNPGTGKTYYIRHLMNSEANKRFVYIPPNMTNVISEPSFINFAIENLNNTVLVIEDAENVISQRKGQQNQSVSNLLNLSDGLMSDVLNLQIICTFNCEIDQVDSALRRKGRLLLMYEFKELAKSKVNALLQEFGMEPNATDDMSLAEIYNEEENNGNKEQRKIGFQ